MYTTTYRYYVPTEARLGLSHQYITEIAMSQMKQKSNTKVRFMKKTGAPQGAHMEKQRWEVLCERVFERRGLEQVDGTALRRTKPRSRKERCSASQTHHLGFRTTRTLLGNAGNSKSAWHWAPCRSRADRERTFFWYPDGSGCNVEPAQE